MESNRFSVRDTRPVGAIESLPLKTGASRHVDVVLIVGPDQDRGLVEQAERECKAGGLSFCFAKVDSSELRERLGPDTHVFVIGHGSKTDKGHEVYLHSWWTPTTTELTGLREPYKVGSNTFPAWTGPLHLLACEEGALLDEIKPGSDLWNGGPILLYGSRSRRPMDLPGEDVPASIHFIAQCKKQGVAVNGMQAFARLANWTGETVSILGGDLEAPVTMHAPKVPADIAPGALEAELRCRQLHEPFDRKPRLAGSDKDLQTLATVVKEQKEGGRASVNPDRPAAVLFLRANRGTRQQVELLLNEHPELLNQRDRGGHRTALIWACLAGNVPVIELLLERGATVHDATDVKGRGALKIAFDARNPEMVRWLCRYGADPTESMYSTARANAYLPVYSEMVKAMEEELSKRAAANQDPTNTSRSRL